MEYESLEEKQQAFDAWKAGQEKPKSPATSVPVKVKKEAPVAAAATKKAYVDSVYILFLQILAVACYLGGVIFIITMVVFEKMSFVYMLSMVSCFFSGLLWQCAAHALRLLEEIHWRK